MAGGHQGRVVVYATGSREEDKEDEEVDTDDDEWLFSFRGHRGWIGQVQFVSHSSYVLFFLSLYSSSYCSPFIC